MLVLAAKVVHHSRSMGHLRNSTTPFGHLARLSLPSSTCRAISTEATTKSPHQTPPNGGQKEGTQTEPAPFPAPSFQREHSSSATTSPSSATTPPPSPMFASSPTRRLVVLAGDGGTTLLTRLMRTVGLAGWWDSAAKRWGLCALI